MLCAAAASVTCMAAIACAFVPGQAPEEAFTPAPLPTPETVYPEPELGDCFGGVFSSLDALHCYALDRAESEGIIDIEKIYDDSGSLHLSLRQEGPVGGDLYQFLRDRATEFVDRWPHLVPQHPNLYCEEFGSLMPYRECLLHSGGYLPRSMQYERILLHTGGEPARRKISGWATWRQAWPEVEGSRANIGRDADARFDVSDVDVVNIPEPDCLDWRMLSAGCGLSKHFPNVGFAGRSGGRGTVYYQIKNPPTDEAEIAALKDKLIPCNTLEPCTYINALGNASSANRTRVTPQEFIPVKYDFRELWRWATILDRFALSEGNTIGIVKALIGTNIGGYPRGTLWPVEGFTQAPYDGYGSLPRTVRGDGLGLVSGPAAHGGRIAGAAAAAGHPCRRGGGRRILACLWALARGASRVAVTEDPWSWRRPAVPQGRNGLVELRLEPNKIDGPAGLA